MYLETERLIIRSMESADEEAFIKRASDGSLNEDVFGGWDGTYEDLIRDWLAETMNLEAEEQAGIIK